MNDKIIIKGLKILAYHGVKEQEKRDGQNFILDCILFVNRNKLRFQDSIDDTISYSTVARIIKCTMQKKSYNLIETAAEYVAQNLFKEFASLIEVDITLKKPEAPIKDLDFEYVAVNIRRKRGDFV